jgi:hypothetical protein
MAQKRMFSKTITNSSRFLMMPQSAQNLYFHLGMNADDDGFCEHFTIMRMTESKPDDLKILQAKSFVKIFDEKVLIIRDWRENNYIRSDRYTPSGYLEVYKRELKLLSGIPEDNQMATQIRLDKISIDKDICMFEKFWKEYPRKENKKKAEQIWKSKNLNSSYEKISEFLKKARETDRWSKGIIPHPTTFLNGERWEDDLSGYGKVEKKPFYKGDPMVKVRDKWKVIINGEFYEFADKENSIEWK